MGRGCVLARRRVRRGRPYHAAPEAWPAVRYRLRPGNRSAASSLAFGLQRAQRAERARRTAMTPGTDVSPQLRRRYVYAAETRAYQALSADGFR